MADPPLARTHTPARQPAERARRRGALGAAHPLQHFGCDAAEARVVIGDGVAWQHQLVQKHLQYTQNKKPLTPISVHSHSSNLGALPCPPELAVGRQSARLAGGLAAVLLCRALPCQRHSAAIRQRQSRHRHPRRAAAVAGPAACSCQPPLHVAPLPPHHPPTTTTTIAPSPPPNRPNMRCAALTPPSRSTSVTRVSSNPASVMHISQSRATRSCLGAPAGGHIANGTALECGGAGSAGPGPQRSAPRTLLVKCGAEVVAAQPRGHSRQPRPAPPAELARA